MSDYPCGEPESGQLFDYTLLENDSIVVNLNGFKYHQAFLEFRSAMYICSMLEVSGREPSEHS